jgi:hypothetical protein
MVLLVALVAAGYTVADRSNPPALHGIRLIVPTPDGTAEAIVEEHRYNAFAAEATAAIQAAKKQASDALSADLDRELSELTADMAPGIDAFADWYYAWGTSQELLWTSARAYGYAVAFNTGSPADAAADAMRQAFEKRFIELVLQPDVSTPRLEAALQRGATAALTRYSSTAARLHAAALQLVRETPVADRALEVIGVVDLTQPGQLSGHEAAKSGVLPTMSGDFSALVRRTILETAGKTIPQRASDIQGPFRGHDIESTEKVVAIYSTMLIAPLVSMLSSAAATGTAAGGTAAIASAPIVPMFSPEILVATYALSFLLDYGLTKATDYTTRAEFVARTAGVLTAVRTQWLDKFKPEFAAYVDAIYGDESNKLDYERAITQ